MSEVALQASAAAEEEQSFPRGGASSITPLKRRQIRAEAQADAEKDFFAGASAGAPASNKRQKKSARAGSTQVRLFAETVPLASKGRRQTGPTGSMSLSLCHEHLNALQDPESSFLSREFAQGKVPAFVELLKFKV